MKLEGRPSLPPERTRVNLCTCTSGIGRGAVHGMIRTGQEIDGKVQRSVGRKSPYAADEKMHAKQMRAPQTRIEDY